MNWKQYLETILILFAVFTLALLAANVAFSERLIVVSMATLALYYLMSGTLVLFDKRVSRPMRIIYFVGLWSIFLGLMGLIFRLRFWVNSASLLLLAVSLGAGALVVLLVMRQLSGEEGVRAQLRPLFIRLLLFPAIFLVFYSISNKELYKSFGEYRTDSRYIELFMESLDNPSDSVKQHRLENYEDSLNQIP